MKKLLKFCSGKARLHYLPLSSLTGTIWKSRLIPARNVRISHSDSLYSNSQVLKSECTRCHRPLAWHSDNMDPFGAIVNWLDGGVQYFKLLWTTNRRSTYVGSGGPPARSLTTVVSSHSFQHLDLTKCWMNVPSSGTTSQAPQLSWGPGEKRTKAYWNESENKTWALVGSIVTDTKAYCGRIHTVQLRAPLKCHGVHPLEPKASSKPSSTLTNLPTGPWPLWVVIGFQYFHLAVRPIIPRLGFAISRYNKGSRQWLFWRPIKMHLWVTNGFNHGP